MVVAAANHHQGLMGGVMDGNENKMIKVSPKSFLKLPKLKVFLKTRDLTVCWRKSIYSNTLFGEIMIRELLLNLSFLET